MPLARACIRARKRIRTCSHAVHSAARAIDPVGTSRLGPPPEERHEGAHDRHQQVPQLVEDPDDADHPEDPGDLHDAERPHEVQVGALPAGGQEVHDLVVDRHEHQEGVEGVPPPVLVAVEVALVHGQLEGQLHDVEDAETLLEASDREARRGEIS